MGQWSLVPTVEFLYMLNLEHVILATIYISLLMLLQGTVQPTGRQLNP